MKGSRWILLAIFPALRPYVVLRNPNLTSAGRIYVLNKSSGLGLGFMDSNKSESILDRLECTDQL